MIRYLICALIGAAFVLAGLQTGAITVDQGDPDDGVPPTIHIGGK
jgi:hypothetical protein